MAVIPQTGKLLHQRVVAAAADLYGNDHELVGGNLLFDIFLAPCHSGFFLITKFGGVLGLAVREKEQDRRGVFDDRRSMAELVDALLHLKQRSLQCTAGQSQTFAVKVDIFALLLLGFDFTHGLENEDIAVECNDREFKNVAGNGVLQNIVIKFTDKALEQIPVGVHRTRCVDHDGGGTTFISVHHVHRLSYDTSGLLGPPGRWLLWFHGCSRSCPGCIAADWNNADAEYELSFQTLTRLLDTHPDAEGITISGGEPFGQSAFLADLTEHLNRHGLGIILYTGFTLGELRAMKEPAVERVLAVTDSLIDGPYRAELDDGKAFRGSANQVIHHLTPRYRAYFSVPAERRTTIQKNGGVYSLTGIPTERAKEEWLSLHRKFSKGEMIP